MRFFALDTDTEAMKKSFLTEGEREILQSYYHGMSFFLAIVREIIVTVVLAGVGAGAIYLDLKWIIVSGVLFVVWFLWVFVHLVKAYLDWRHDFLVVTTDKLFLVDQTSIFRQRVTPITLDNFASVAAESQFFNLFNFGKVIFNLKEGAGGEMVLGYVPKYKHVAAVLADAVTKFQRRRTQQTQPQTSA